MQLNENVARTVVIEADFNMAVLLQEEAVRKREMYGFERPNVDGLEVPNCVSCSEARSIPSSNVRAAYGCPSAREEVARDRCDLKGQARWNDSCVRAQPIQPVHHPGLAVANLARGEYLSSIRHPRHLPCHRTGAEASFPRPSPQFERPGADAMLDVSPVAIYRAVCSLASRRRRRVIQVEQSTIRACRERVRDRILIVTDEGVGVRRCILGRCVDVARVPTSARRTACMAR